MSNVKLTKKQAEELCGTLSNPSKMPGKAIGLPAANCKTGQRLADAGVDGPCRDCYAMRNFYAMPNVQESQANRLSKIEDSGWEDGMVRLVQGETWFRWHDSGDVQSLGHFTRMMRVAERTPDTKHWVPTQEWGIVRKFVREGGKIPANVTIRFSARKYGDTPRNVWTQWSSVAQHEEWQSVLESGQSHGLDAFACPSHNQDNACGDCRACWDPTVKWVIYRKH